MSPEVVSFLLQLVNNQVLSAGSPEFSTIADLISKSKVELAAMLEDDLSVTVDVTE